LARSQDELYETDIADYALEALKNSRVKNIYILGRRGAAQAAFTNPEIKELGEMEEAAIIVGPDEVDLDLLSKDYVATVNDRTVTRNVEILTEYAERQQDNNKPKRIIMRFLTSPVEIIGEKQVEAMKIVKNELYLNERGVLRPRATEQFETIPAGLIFRSVGYRGVPLEDVPFREDWGTIPNEKGRIINWETKDVVNGEYVVGWIKRGPSGVIGTNKPDSQETVSALLDDVEHGVSLQPSKASAAAVEALIKERKPNYVAYADWQIIDQLEIERGEAIGRSRLKFTRVSEMLDALAEHKKSLITN